MGIENRGFASLPPWRQLELARKGGRSVHALGRAYRWTPEKAREAGLKGTAAKRAKKAARS